MDNKQHDTPNVDWMEECSDILNHPLEDIESLVDEEGVHGANKEWTVTMGGRLFAVAGETSLMDTVTLSHNMRAPSETKEEHKKEVKTIEAALGAPNASFFKTKKVAYKYQDIISEPLFARLDKIISEKIRHRLRAMYRQQLENPDDIL